MFNDPVFDFETGSIRRSHNSNITNHHMHTYIEANSFLLPFLTSSMFVSNHCPICNAPQISSICLIYSLKLQNTFYVACSLSIREYVN